MHVIVTHAPIALVRWKRKRFQQALEVVYSNIWISGIVRESSRPSGQPQQKSGGYTAVITATPRPKSTDCRPYS